MQIMKTVTIAIARVVMMIMDRELKPPKLNQR
jgi:hypothetical protein